MSILAKAKAKAFNGNVKEAFRNEAGAIDLASIMVGIIVIGLIGGVIAATVFAVIPWAQDNAAKGQLESVVQAQNAYTGLSSDGTLKDASGDAVAAGYGDAAALKAAKLLGDVDGLTLNVTPGAPGNGGGYEATLASASGKTFEVTNANPKPHLVP